MRNGKPIFRCSWWFVCFAWLNRLNACPDAAWQWQLCSGIHLCAAGVTQCLWPPFQILVLMRGPFRSSVL